MSHDEQSRFPLIRVNGMDFSRRITAKYGYFVKPRRFLSLIFRRLTDNRNQTIISNIFITRVINTNYGQYLNTFRYFIEQLDQTQISNRLTKNLLFKSFFQLQIIEVRKEGRDAKKDYIQPHYITSSYKAGWPILRTKYQTTILKRQNLKNVLSYTTGNIPVNPLISLFNRENKASFFQEKFESHKIADFSTSIHSTRISTHQERSIRDRIIHQRIPETISSTKLVPETSPQQIHGDSAPQYPIDRSIKLERESLKENIHKLRTSTLVKEENYSLEPSVFKKYGKLATDEKSVPMSILDLTVKNEGREMVPAIHVKNNFTQKNSTFHYNVMRKYPHNYKTEVISNNFTRQSARSEISDQKIGIPVRRELQPVEAKFQHINNRQETTQLNQLELKKDITLGISDLIMRKPISHNIEKSPKDISENIDRSINRKYISTIVTESSISKKDETTIIADKVYKMIENKLLIEKERRGIT